MSTSIMVHSMVSVDLSEMLELKVMAKLKPKKLFGPKGFETELIKQHS